MNEQKRKTLAPELAKGVKTAADLNQFTRMLTKRMMETALNAKFTEHLGYGKNARKTDPNTRNRYISTHCSATTLSLN